MTERWLSELEKIDQMEPSLDLLERAERRPSLPEPGPRPSRRIGIAVFAILVAVAGSWGAFAALRGSSGIGRGPASGPEGFNALWPETSLTDAQGIQARVDAGDPDVQWRTDAGAVALRFAEEKLGWPDPIAGVTATDDPDTVRVSLHGPDASCQGAECGGPQPAQTIVNVTLQRLARSGEGGIWSVTAVDGGEQSSPSAAYGEPETGGASRVTGPS